MNPAMPTTNNDPAMNNEHWYTHGWLWFVMLVPFTAVLFGVVMITSANHQPDDLVVDNYYKEGKGINLRLGQDQKAAEAGARARLAAVTDTGAVFEMAMASTDVQLSLFHVSDASMDLVIDLVDNGTGIYTAHSAVLANRLGTQGIWYIEIADRESGWRLKARVETPINELELKP